MSKPAISIIIPTFREAGNLGPLVRRAFEALSQTNITAEMIVVDDNSQDGTEEIIRSLSSSFPVRCVVRTRERGLSSAVITGFQHARYDRFLVMDADLQHPPEVIPALATVLDQNDCDFALASRYARGGQLPQEWPWIRKLASRFATLLAKPLVDLSDPMSGFFAIPREVWVRAAPLDPIGFKIALELYVKGRCRHPREVPFTFGIRPAGESKFNVREQWRYARHLLRLYRFRYPLAVGFLIAAVVVAVGLVVWRLVA
jgi:dolichol-phosphate mannosyltransferase